MGPRITIKTPCLQRSTPEPKKPRSPGLISRVLQRPHPKVPVVNSSPIRDTEGGEARPRRSKATRRPERTAEPVAARPLRKPHKKIPITHSGLASKYSYNKI